MWLCPAAASLPSFQQWIGQHYLPIDFQTESQAGQADSVISSSKILIYSWLKANNNFNIMKNWKWGADNEIFVYFVLGFFVLFSVKCEYTRFSEEARGVFFLMII